MLTIIPRSQTVETIQQGLKNELSDLVVSYPDIGNRILDGVLWGIFSEKSPFSEQKSDKKHYDYVADLSYDVVALAKKELALHGETDAKIFHDDVDKMFKNYPISIYLDREDCEVKVKKSLTEDYRFKADYQATIGLTLPDVDTVFGWLDWGSLSKEDKKLCGKHMESYMHWRYDTMKSLHDLEWQIGGHGRWIQLDYNGTFIAQNNQGGLGDGGSIYIYVKDSEICGDVDMY